MSPLDKVRDLISSLSPDEKAQALQWLARDAGDGFPGVERTPGVVGGDPCLVRTRIPVWVLVQARRLGSSEAEILRAYPYFQVNRPRTCADRYAWRNKP